MTVHTWFFWGVGGRDAGVGAWGFGGLWVVFVRKEGLWGVMNGCVAGGMTWGAGEEGLDTDRRKNNGRGINRRPYVLMHCNHRLFLPSS